MKLNYWTVIADWNDKKEEEKEKEEEEVNWNDEDCYHWFDLIWFEFIHSCDIDLNLTYEGNYAMYIERTKLSERENRSSTT